jgi:hypothetical protein
MNTKLKKNKKQKNNFVEKEKEKEKEKENNSDNLNECFICLEYYHNNETTIKLIESKYCEKLCICDGWVHNYCLNKWYSMSFVCPICRTNIFNDDNTNANNANINANVIIIQNNTEVNQSNFLLKIFILFCIYLIYYP